MKAIADTGFLVAFLNGRDAHHDWAVALARQADAPLLTCEAVLSEAAFHVRNSELVLNLVSSGLVKLAFEARQHVKELARLASRYADREPDLADLCLIRMAELHRDYPVITVDERDFRVYRRNGRDVIPLITPG